MPITENAFKGNDDEIFCFYSAVSSAGLLSFSGKTDVSRNSVVRLRKGLPMCMIAVSSLQSI